MGAQNDIFKNNSGNYYFMYEANPSKFSKSQTDHAGELLCNSSTLKEEKFKALEILSNWRASHSYPMHIFKKR
jgi:hypothetical protein